MTKCPLNSLKVGTVLRVSLLNHTLAGPLSVVGNAFHIILSRTPCKCMRVLNNSRWSSGSCDPLYVSICGPKWGYTLFSKKFQQNTHFLKLFRDISLFWNLIFRKLSYSQIKLKKKKKKKLWNSSSIWKFSRNSSSTLKLNFDRIEFQNKGISLKVTERGHFAGIFRRKGYIPILFPFVAFETWRGGGRKSPVLWRVSLSLN